MPRTNSSFSADVDQARSLASHPLLAPLQTLSELGERGLLRGKASTIYASSSKGPSGAATFMFAIFQVLAGLLELFPLDFEFAFLLPHVGNTQAAPSTVLSRLAREVQDEKDPDQSHFVLVVTHTCLLRHGHYGACLPRHQLTQSCFSKLKFSVRSVVTQTPH